MSNSNPIRWGVIGTGWVAQRFMADLVDCNASRLEAVASRNEDRASELATRFGAQRGHGSYEALLKDDSVDVVYVASEHHEHVAHCLAAIEAGKHVLCEKPFATSHADALRVCSAAKARGVFCMEAMWTRFLPAALHAKHLMTSGAIGEARLFSADFGIPVVQAEDSRFLDPTRGGGALLDRGVYAVSMAVWLFGKPQRVIASGASHSRGADLSVTALLVFPDDRLANLSASLQAYSSNAATIAGTTGRITLQEPFFCPTTVSLAKAHVTSAQSRSDLRPTSPKERVKRVLSHVKPYLPLGALRSTTTRHRIAGFGYGYEAAEVERCIREGLTESPLMPLSETLTVMSVIDEIRAQIK